MVTDLNKLASKYAKGMGNRPELLVRDAIKRALKELQTRVVLDVKRSSPATALVADRIIRNRPIPVQRGNYRGAQVSARIEYKDIIIYAIEQGRLLERREREAIEHAAEQVEAELHEYGWHWNESPHKVHLVVGHSGTLESARRAMYGTHIKDGEYKIVARAKGHPGEWKATQ